MKLRNVLLGLTALVAAPSFAMAQEVTTSANIAITSDSIWRGVSQTDGDPAVSAGLDVAAGNLYLGTWFSNVDWQPDAEFEWDIYAGYKPVVGPVTLDIGALLYMYPQDSNLQVAEFKFGGSVATPGDQTLGLAYYYSPEVGKGGPASGYTEVSFGGPLSTAKVGPFALSYGLSYGVYNYEDTLPDYNNWRAALTGTMENGIAVELAYADTSEHALGSIFDSHTTITLKKAF